MMIYIYVYISLDVGFVVPKDGPHLPEDAIRSRTLERGRVFTVGFGPETAEASVGVPWPPWDLGLLEGHERK